MGNLTLAWILLSAFVVSVFSLFSLAVFDMDAYSQLSLANSSNSTDLYIRTWSNWQPLDAEVLKSPAVIQDSQKRLNVFVVGNDSSLYYKTQNLSAQVNGTDQWSEWNSLGGIVGSDPAVIRDSQGRLNLFVVGNGSSLLSKIQNTSALENGTDQWSAWNNLGGELGGNPTVISDDEGRIHIFVRGSDNALYHKALTSSVGQSQMPDWNNLGGELEGDPAVIIDDEGTINIFSRGSENALYHNALTVSSTNGAAVPFITRGEIQSSGWNNLGGELEGDPAVISDDEGRILIFVKQTDDALYYNALPEEDESGSRVVELGGIVTSDPTLVRDSQGRLNVFVLGSESSVYYKVQNATDQEDDASQWSLWNGVGGKLRIVDPVVVRDSQDRLNIFVVGADGDIYKKVELLPTL